MCDFWVSRQMLSFETRKSSCVNARGIPTAAYQVLHVLSCPGGIPHVPSACLGYTPPVWGTPPVLTWLGGGVPRYPRLAGVPPTWLGYPPIMTWPGEGVTGYALSGWGTPCLGYPDPVLNWPGGYPDTPT